MTFADVLRTELRAARQLYPPLRHASWRIVAAVTAALVTIHILATWGHGGHLLEPTLSKIAIWPGMPNRLLWHYLYALLFHFSWQHLIYNVVVFAAAYPIAARAHGTWRPLVLSYLAAPIVLFSLDLAVIRPMAAADIDYALRAMDTRLVGFSVCAYAALGLALAAASRKLRALAIFGWLVGDGFAAVAAFGTRPYVFAFHWGGLFLGMWFGFLHLREPTAAREPVLAADESVGQAQSK